MKTRLFSAVVRVQRMFQSHEVSCKFDLHVGKGRKDRTSLMIYNPPSSSRYYYYVIISNNPSKKKNKLFSFDNCKLKRQRINVFPFFSLAILANQKETGCKCSHIQLK